MYVGAVVLVVLHLAKLKIVCQKNGLYLFNIPQTWPSLFFYSWYHSFGFFYMQTKFKGFNNFFLNLQSCQKAPQSSLIKVLKWLKEMKVRTKHVSLMLTVLSLLLIILCIFKKSVMTDYDHVLPKDEIMVSALSWHC